MIYSNEINLTNMAQYKVPGQNLTFGIPDEGQVYRDPNDPWGTSIFVRTQNQIRGLNVQAIGQKSLRDKAAELGFNPDQIYQYADAKRAEEAGLPISWNRSAGTGSVQFQGGD